MLIPAEVIKEKVVRLLGFSMGVHGMLPENCLSGMPLLIHARRDGDKNLNPSTVLLSFAISFLLKEPIPKRPLFPNLCVWLKF